MKIPLNAVEIAVAAVNAGEAELSYLEHVLIEAKSRGLFNGSVESAVQVLEANGFAVWDEVSK